MAVAVAVPTSATAQVPVTVTTGAASTAPTPAGPLGPTGPAEPPPSALLDDPTPTPAGALAASTAILLRPAPPLRDLAEAVAILLRVRLPVPVTVGDAVPAGVLEAVRPGHVALEPAGDGVIRLVLGAPGGRTLLRPVPLGEERQGAARALAHAVEALREAALAGPPAPMARSPRTSGAIVYLEPVGQELGEAAGGRAPFRPLLSASLIAAFSTRRESFQLGPRVAFGLCQRGQCLAVEAGLALMSDRRRSCDGLQLRYRPLDVAIRAQVRPWSFGDLRPALSAGFVSRVGLLNVPELRAQPSSTSFGLRLGLEGAWRFSRILEVVAELGVDLLFGSHGFRRDPPSLPDCPPPGALEVLMAEDTVTLWVRLGFRVPS